MPSYDPQRTRSRRRLSDEEGTAPVDALLGPVPDEPPAPAAEPVPAARTPAEPSPPLIVDLDRPTAVPVPRHRGRAVLWLLAVVSLVVQVVLYLWWRRRRSPG